MSFGFSQDLLLGFEAAESGGLDGGPFGNGNALAVNLVPGTGTNTTQVAEFIANSGGEIWQGININLTTDVDLTSTQTMTIDVKSATAITFLAKVNDGTGDEAAAAVTHNGDNTWQTLSFTFDTVLDGKAPAANGTYNGFVIHAYWAPGAITFGDVTADERTFYVDNISGPESTDTCSNGIEDGDETGVDCGGSCPNACPSPPTTAAPTPPARAAADVISLFSDAYTDIAIDTFDTSWCPATTTSVMVAGNATQEVTGLGCEGVEFITDRFDATSFTHFHMDIWTTADTMDKSWNLKLVNFAGGTMEANAIEFSTTNASSPSLPNPNPGTWISLDIPLASWTPGAREDLTQFVITSDMGTVYYDNLYLHKDTVLSVDNKELLSFNVYPNPTQGNWTVKAQNNTKITSINVYDVLGKNVLSLSPSKNEETINGSSLKSGLYFAQIKTENGLKSVKLVKK